MNEREEFERVMKGKVGHLMRRHEPMRQEEYEHHCTQAAWLAWKARGEFERALFGNYVTITLTEEKAKALLDAMAKEPWTGNVRTITGATDLAPVRMTNEEHLAFMRGEHRIFKRVEDRGPIQCSVCGGHFPIHQKGCKGQTEA